MAGYFEKRGKETYRLIVYAGTNSAGTRIAHRKTIKGIKSDREAGKQLALFVAEVEGGRALDANKFTFKQLIELFFTDYADKELAPKTVHRYKQLAARVKFALGHIRLDKLKSKHFFDFYTNLAEEGTREDGKEGGLDYQTIVHHHRLCNTVINKAIQWEIMKDNPADKVNPIKSKKAKTKKTPKHYNEDQLPLLFEALEKEKEKRLKWVVAVLIVLATGMRKEEIMGLEWPDADIEGCTFTINRTSQYVDKKRITGQPKTEESQRTVTAPKSLMELLKRYKAVQNEERLLLGDKWQKTERIIHGVDGTDSHPDAFAQWFRRFVIRHKLPHISLHGLRHTNASFLISKKIDLKTVSARLGHSRTSTTQDIYTHIMKKPDKEAVKKIAKLIDIK